MKLKIWTTLFSLTLAQFAWGQASGNSKLVNTEGTAPEASATSYTVLGATSEQETLVRAQIRIMQPDVYPLRVLFVPHWKYVDTASTFRLHFPAGYTSAMFTHLPSRSVFIDSDRCAGIHVASSPSNAIAKTTPANTSGSRGVA